MLTSIRRLGALLKLRWKLRMWRGVYLSGSLTTGRVFHRSNSTTSSSASHAGQRRQAPAIRNHWSLNVAFREDNSRIRSGHADHNSEQLPALHVGFARFTPSKPPDCNISRIIGEIIW